MHLPPTRQNPLLLEWATPFGMPPFDRIRPEHFPAAFERGMAEHLIEVEAVASDGGEPTFANTMEALERSGRLLDRSRAVFDSLAAVEASEAIQAVARDWAPRLARHSAAVALHPGVFRRVAAVHSRRHGAGLAPDQIRLVERRHASMRREGAALPPGDRIRLTEISAALAELETRFGQNVLHDEDAWVMVLAESDLDGLPASARDAAREAAVSRGFPGGYAITLSRSSVEPFLASSTRRDLRQRVHAAWSSRGRNAGERDNRPLVGEILALRRERASLLGFPSFADLRLEDTMARSPAAAEALLRRVWAPARSKAESERAEIEALARSLGADGPIEAWDWRFYAAKARAGRGGPDDAAVKDFLTLDNVLRAVFDVAHRLFGVSFAERRGLPLYHRDARAYEALGRDGEHLGLLLLDNHARPGKKSGAWMSSYRVGETFDGPVAPIVAVHNNLAAGNPTLLRVEEAETVFHEFGHALHGLLGRARYPSQSGTAVLDDFVEFPSQVLEHWFSARPVLRAHARHHATGEPMPDGMVDALGAVQACGQGFETAEFVAAAMADLALHTHPDPAGLDVDAFEEAFLRDIGMPRGMGLRHRPAHFDHLFGGGGYAAGYYAYLWSEVMDADGFEAFEESGDVFDPALAARLRAVYEAGDTRDPMELYKAFRGRGPDPDALLRNRGLLGPEGGGA